MEGFAMMRFLRDSGLVILGSVISALIAIVASNFLAKPGVSPMITFALMLLFTLPVVLVLSFLSGLRLTYQNRATPYRYTALTCLIPLLIHFVMLGPFGLFLFMATIFAAMVGTARGLSAE
jgi:uncharacterized membrane protein